MSLQGEEYEPCKFFEKNFKTICPAAWIEKWDEQREKVSKFGFSEEKILISALSERLPRQHLEPHCCVYCVVNFNPGNKKIVEKHCK